MSDKNKVVWSEGLFLRTQHFQQQDRYTEGLVRGALQAAPMQSFGFRSLTLDKPAIRRLIPPIGRTVRRAICASAMSFRLRDGRCGMQAFSGPPPMTPKRHF